MIKTHRQRAFWIAALCMLASATLAYAQPIALLAWDTTGNSGITADPYAATAVAANMQSSALNRGSGLTATSLSNGYASSGWDGTTNLTQATAANNFLQFTAQAASSFALSADAIEMNFRTTGTGPMTFQWVYSFDGFATAGTAIGTATTRSNPGSGTQVDNYTIDLSEILALQEFTTAVTFRLYGWDASGSAGTAAFGNSTGNNLVLIGTAQLIPEPASMALLLTGSLLVLARRRRSVSRA